LSLGGGLLLPLLALLLLCRCGRSLLLLKEGSLHVLMSAICTNVDDWRHGIVLSEGK